MKRAKERAVVNHFEHSSSKRLLDQSMAGDPMQVVTGSCRSIDSLQALVSAMLEPTGSQDPQVQLSCLLQIDQWLVSSQSNTISALTMDMTSSTLGFDDPIARCSSSTISAQQIASHLSREKRFVRHLQDVMRIFMSLEQLLLVLCNVLHQLCQLHQVVQLQMGELEIWHELRSFGLHFPQQPIVQHRMWQTLASLVVGNERNAQKILQSHQVPSTVCSVGSSYGTRFVFVRDACDALALIRSCGCADSECCKAAAAHQSPRLADLREEMVSEIVRFLKELYSHENIRFADQPMVQNVWTTLVQVLQSHLERYQHNGVAMVDGKPQQQRGGGSAGNAVDPSASQASETIPSPKPTPHERLVCNCLRVCRLLIRKEQAHVKDKMNELLMTLFDTRVTPPQKETQATPPSSSRTGTCSTKPAAANGSATMTTTRHASSRRSSISATQRATTRKVTALAVLAPSAFASTRKAKSKSDTGQMDTRPSTFGVVNVLVATYQTNASLLVDLMAIFTDVFAIPSVEQDLAGALEARFHLVSLVVQTVKPKLELVGALKSHQTCRVEDQVLWMESFRLLRQLSSIQSVRKRLTDGFVLHDLLPLLVVALDRLLSISGSAGFGAVGANYCRDLTMEVLICVENAAYCVAELHAFKEQAKVRAEPNAVREVVEQLQSRLHHWTTERGDTTKPGHLVKAKTKTKTKTKLMAGQQQQQQMKHKQLLSTDATTFVLEQQRTRSLKALQVCVGTDL